MLRRAVEYLFQRSGSPLQNFVDYTHVIFDLDGVLIESKGMHWETLNQALAQSGLEFKIPYERHISQFDGLSTWTKLEMLSRENSIPESKMKEIWGLKQQITSHRVSAISPNPQIVEVFRYLRDKGIVISVVSNAVRDTVRAALVGLQVEHLVELIVTNEDLTLNKPHPAPYWHAMTRLGADPEKTLILEDSAVGRRAAARSGANLLSVKSPRDVTLEFIQSALNRKVPRLRWSDERLNVLIPMAGLGSRFSTAGFTFPKPLIEINKKPMIELVVENLAIDAHYIFIVQKDVSRKFNLRSLLPLIAGNAELIEIEGTTEGAAVTALKAKELIDNANPLLIANSDQVVDWDSSRVMYSFERPEVDAGILTFEATHPKWSFVKRGENGLVQEVAEKKPISNEATCGIYYWKRGADFVASAEEMIQKDIRTNGEYYIAPAFNEFILKGGKVLAERVQNMWGLGTPEDLESFLSDDEHKRFV